LPWQNIREWRHLQGHIPGVADAFGNAGRRKAVVKFSEILPCFQKKAVLDKSFITEIPDLS
jgi:hypothetical protein